MKKAAQIQDERQKVSPPHFIEDDKPPVLVTVAWIAAVFALVFLCFWIATSEGVV